MYSKICFASIVACIGAFSPLPLAAATIAADREFPTRNEQIQLLISNDDGNPIAGANVTVTYRPGSSVEKTDTLGLSGPNGAVQWTPSDAGIATVTATWPGAEQAELSAATTVSVRFQRPPWDGIIIMIVAGLLLTVGSVIRIVRLLRSPEFS